MLNAQPKIIESVARFAEITRTANDTGDHKEVTYATFVDRLALVMEAQTWYLDNDAVELLWRTELTNTGMDQVWTPADNMLVEFNYPYGFLNLPAFTSLPVGTASKNRVLHITPYSLKRRRFGETDPENKAFAITEFFDSRKVGVRVNDRFGKWGEDMYAFVPYALVVTEPLLLTIEAWTNKVDEFTSIRTEGDETTAPFLAGVLPSDGIKELFGVVTEDDNYNLIKTSLTSVAADSFIFLTLMMILATDNAPVETIAAPAKLNKKRKKRGKPLIPSYRTLHLTRRQRVDAGKVRGEGTERKVSPHYRNGHVRRQWYPSIQEHKKKWIHPTMVGVGDIEPTSVKVKK